MLRSHLTLLRRPWLILGALFLFFSVPLLFLRSAPFERVNGWLKTTAKFGPVVPVTVPEIAGFYDWDTKSAFSPVRQPGAADKSLEELCASFPTHLLDEVQPVLKTGHGVLDARVRPQLQSVSACLSNLLIFSDVEETYEGHEIIDVIEDISPDLVAHEPKLSAWRDGSLMDGDEAGPDVPKRKNPGWASDKFKFFPSVTRAWRMRPRRSWYVFYEADTYIVWDNVFRLLEHFNPDEPHYFGSPSPGRVEDYNPELPHYYRAFKNGRETTWFANGGPGYILSREAMRRLVSDDWDPDTGEYLGMNLVARYWDLIVDDCCGDSILGLALWEHNVSLSGLFPMFSPHPPHGTPFADRFWCQPILTMHKPVEEDLLGLWRWQWEHRSLNRPLLYRDLAMSYFNLSTLEFREDWHNGGGDSFASPVPSKYYSHDPHESFDACGKACMAHDQCLQYQYHLRRCEFMRTMQFGEPREPGLYKANGKVDTEKSSSMWLPEDLRFMAGWDVEKIGKWTNEHPCEQVKWVRPSIKRIF